MYLSKCSALQFSHYLIDIIHSEHIWY